MTSFKTYIKQESKLNKILLGFLFLSFIILIFHKFILSNFSGTASTIILTFGILGTLSLFTIIIFFRNSNFIEGITTNGTLSIDEQQIRYLDQSFNLSELKDIYIFYAGYPKSKEQIHVYNAGNFIKFNFNETSHKIFFLIEGEQDRQKLVMLLKTFHTTGINFKETTSQGTSYYLDINLNYADIQRHKTIRQN